jgi:M6 family metalloprotease-like protein
VKFRNILVNFILALSLAACGSGGSGGSSAEEEPDVTIPIPTARTQKPMLAILLSYNDVSFTSGVSVWGTKLFGTNPKELNHYYNEVSLGEFGLVPADENESTLNDGIISITLDKNHPDSGSENTIHPDLKQALEAADAYIDYALYDTNNDAKISSDELALLFIVAGNEDAYSGANASEGVWAHSWCTQAINTPLLDGVSLMGCASGGSFALFGERHNKDGDDHDATIGIIAHELGHSIFSLPDLYDIDDSSGGIGYFGMMGTGNWGREIAEFAGNTPTHFCAWSKVTLGWVNPELITQTNALSVELHESASTAFNIFKLPIGVNEYFLLENRNNNGYDRGLYPITGTFSGGLAIWHIDENIIANKLYLNEVNADETHKGVDIEEAAFALLDASSSSIGHEKNLYYSGNIDLFDASQSYSGTPTGIRVETISTRGAAMHATLSNPN